MSQKQYTTLELRTGRDNENTPESAAQFLSSLPNAPKGILNTFSQADEVFLEFFNQGQMIYSFITLENKHVEYIKSQLTASYPEVLINELEHNPLTFLHNPDYPTQSGELKFSAPNYFPFATYKTFENADPLASILSSLAKLQEDECAVIQYVVRKAKKGWKNTGLSLAQQGIKQSDDTYQPHPHKEAIAQKLNQPSFQISIRIAVQTTNEQRNEQILESLTTAFSSIHSQTNSFVFKKPMFGKDKLTEKIITRTPDFKHQYVSLDELATLFHLPNQQLSTIKNIAWGKNLLGEPPENLPIFTKNMTEEEKNDINLFARTEFKNQNQIFGIKNEDRRRHMYVIGKSGTGKSTLLANMIINDLKHDEGLAVIDPHGDLIETVLDYIPSNRINDTIMFDPTDPEAVVRMNLFEGGSVVHRELIASGIIGIFQKMYAYSWGPRLEYILRNTLLTLLSQRAKLEDILRMLTDKKYRKKVIASLDDEVLKNFWVAEFEEMHDRQRTEAISPILNKVGQFVTSPLVRNVVNAQTSSFDIENVMDKGKILLVNLSQGKLGEDNTALLGAMLITKIQLAAMNRVYTPEKERRDFYLYIDEFQNFATNSFIKILSEARKYRLNLVLANQYMAQIPDDVKAAIFGNAGTMASFILGADDAEYMHKEFGGKYTHEDLVSLGRYQIVTKLMIDNRMSHPFPANTLPLASSKNKNREKVLRVSRERYAKKRE